MKPLVIDLFCGLFGWGSAFAESGYRVVGFDIEDQFTNFGKQKPENCELVLRDIRSLTGEELVKHYGVPACIVASPPCQEFSYMAMPWTKAKEKMRKILGDPAEQKRLTDLFNQCFRIQREVSAAAGHYVPMVVENVRGAQRWVGKARWNFGSFYLWADVPALMPIPAKKILKYGMICAAELTAKNGNSKVALRDGTKLPGNNSERREDREIKRLCDAVPNEGNKTSGMNWSDQTKRGQDFTRIAGKQSEGAKTMNIHQTALKEGVKNFTPNGEPLGKKTLGRMHGSKSNRRKQASAEIAKIPPALAAWIARCYKPK